MVGKVAGFFPYAGVAIKAQELDKLECLTRYIARMATFKNCLLLTEQSKVRYKLKTSL
jgi:hypothetical protein